MLSLYPVGVAEGTFDLAMPAEEHTKTQDSELVEHGHSNEKPVRTTRSSRDLFFDEVHQKCGHACDSILQGSQTSRGESVEGCLPSFSAACQQET